MKKNKSMKIIIGVIFVGVVILLSLLGYNFGQRLFSASGTEEFPGSDVAIVIESGMSKSDVGELLYDEGLIKDDNIFVIQCIIYEAEFFPGEYRLNTSYSPEVIIEKLKVDVNEEETSN